MWREASLTSWQSYEETICLSPSGRDDNPIVNSAAEAGFAHSPFATSASNWVSAQKAAASSVSQQEFRARRRCTAVTGIDLPKSSKVFKTSGSADSLQRANCTAPHTNLDANCSSSSFVDNRLSRGYRSNSVALAATSLAACAPSSNAVPGAAQTTSDKLFDRLGHNHVQPTNVATAPRKPLTRSFSSISVASTTSSTTPAKLWVGLSQSFDSSNRMIQQRSSGFTPRHGKLHAAGLTGTQHGKAHASTGATEPRLSLRRSSSTASLKSAASSSPKNSATSAVTTFLSQQQNCAAPGGRPPALGAHA